MKKRLKSYLEYLEGLNFEGLTENQINILKTNLLNQISFFQHERFVHLIVTVTIALFTLAFVFASLAWPLIPMLIGTGLLLALLFAYICHYYFMENGVQKLYGYYDKLIRRI
ncbi:MAG: hypothetical protein GX319_02990 [Clostridiales bacterium]|jgi:hypothetical protein|nr:hypothetical protein [Bacillota bacterium]NLK03360.1 hypothetical protein [Clostridiales bacterium]